MSRRVVHTNSMVIIQIKVMIIMQYSDHLAEIESRESLLFVVPLKG
jgi:hypothetical protein